jgi:hypothetical protein
MKVRPLLLWLLLASILLAVMLSIFLDNQERVSYSRAKILNTRNDVKQIASVLKQREMETGNLTNIDNSFIFHALFGTNDFRFGYRTNFQGEVLDIWETPYKIEFFQQTNFIIRSAGKDKIFGDADDIIFNSASNDFVKP